MVSFYSPNNSTVCNYHFIFTQKSLSPSGWWSNLPRSTQASILSNQDLPWVRAKSQPWELSVFVCFFLFTPTHPNNLCFIMWTQVPLTTLPILPDTVSGIATDTLAYRSGKKSLHGMDFSRRLWMFGVLKFSKWVATAGMWVGSNARLGLPMEHGMKLYLVVAQRAHVLNLNSWPRVSRQLCNRTSGWMAVHQLCQRLHTYQKCINSLQ